MTDPARYYAELMRSITDDDVYRTLRLLFDHIGQDNKIAIGDMAALDIGSGNVPAGMILRWRGVLWSDNKIRRLA